MPYKNPVDQRVANRRHYVENKAYYKAKARRNRAAHRTPVREYIVDYLLRHPCVDCGESDIVVLDFDHVRGTKRGGVSQLVIGNCSLNVIQTEIDKCEIRCANCHRRKTIKQLGWWQITLGPADSGGWSTKPALMKFNSSTEHHIVEVSSNG